MIAPRLFAASRRPARPRRAGSRGYTAIEVIVAITLFAIGSAGVIGMQRSTIQGNLEARRVDVGQALARQWLERLRRDATLWQVGGPTPDLTRTTWLKNSVEGATGVGPFSAWVLPPAPSAGVAEGMSSRFDTLGRDLAQNDAGLFYCAQYRLEWLVTNQLVRAEVRVFWPRGLEQAPPATFCTNGDASTAAANAQRVYQFVHATTTLRGTPL